MTAICSLATVMPYMRLQSASAPESAHSARGKQMLVSALRGWRDCRGAAHPGTAIADIVLIDHLPDSDAGKASVHPIGTCRAECRFTPDALQHAGPCPQVLSGPVSLK